MGTRCPLLRSRLQNGPGPVPDAAESLPGACSSDSCIEVNQTDAQEDPSHASLFQGSSTRKRRKHSSASKTYPEDRRARNMKQNPFTEHCEQCGSPNVSRVERPISPWEVLAIVPRALGFLSPAFFSLSSRARLRKSRQ